jgi:hypothetical protein
MFFSQISVFRFQYNSTNAPCASIHLLMLYIIFLPVLQFCPVLFHPILRTDACICHRHYVLFFSQYFSFLLFVSFQHLSILIHSSA